ncbi:LOW QUALITY PROTEIN: MORC family CW-type zinc finger protein 4-like [Pluvialis apricaria]
MDRIHAETVIIPPVTFNKRNAHNKEDFEEGKEYGERPDEVWVQCEEYLKWRKLPDQADPTLLPERFCHLHPLPKYSILLDKVSSTQLDIVHNTMDDCSPEKRWTSGENQTLNSKVEKIEREKCRLKTELLKYQQELALLAQKTEGLPCSKKYTCYCQAVWQKRKAKLARSSKEKAELMERLEDTEMHLWVLREPQVSCRGPEEEDGKRSELWVGWLAVPVIPKARGEGRSHPGLLVMEKLENLHMNVSWLLAFILPHLELLDINFESDQVGEVLQTTLEEINLMLE